MATTTPNFGWPVPTSTDLVKDGATAIEGLGDAIDASLLDLKGGTTGQVLTKASNTNMDFSWTAVDPLVILDAKGDLITATAADTPARLAVGTNNQVLTADSTTATGLKWATPASPTSGMTLISRTTFSSVATHAVDVCFTSTYDTYFVIIEGVTGTPTDDLQLQWRTGTGTTYTSANYFSALRAVDYGAGIRSLGTSAGTAYNLTFNLNDSAALWFTGVGNTTETPRWQGTIIDYNNCEAYFGGGMMNANITATGFLLKSSSSNITGEVAVYGLAK